MTKVLLKGLQTPTISLSRNPDREKFLQTRERVRKPFKVGEILLSLGVKHQQHDLTDSTPKPSLHDEANKSMLANDVEDIKHQVAIIPGSLASITPVIAEIENVYYTYNGKAVENMS